MSHSASHSMEALSEMQVEHRLKDAGLRPTRQRLELGHILWSQGDRHVTAEMLMKEARSAKVQVSLATVYNTLHQFTEAGLLKEILIEGGRSYFDTNITSHHHFLYEDSGELMDIDGHGVELHGLPQPPQGTEVSGVEVVVKLRRK